MKKEPTVCLNMIVKNEGKIIERLLMSVLPIIDYYCICDTGSTDNTKEVITTFFKSKNIDGFIFDEKFINFAHNRNVALKKCVGLTDYVLLLDADMVIEVKSAFNKKLLLLDTYTILQGSSSFYYSNQRIIRNNGVFTYLGVTHEYLSTPPNNRSGFLDKDILFINDIGDGGSKSDKFERDIKLLKKGIEDEPNNDRYHFYLANTYHDNGHYNDAIEYYKKRIKMGGWEQEIWYSYYRIGLCYQKMDDIERAIFYWLEAYNVLPNRIENLYSIIEYYRIVGKCNIAYSFYIIAKGALLNTNIKERNTFLFLSNDIYSYKIDYEYSIISCYVGIKNINKELINIFNKCNDSGIISNTLSNMKFYKDILKPSFMVDMGVSLSDKNRAFTSSSSCIIPYNGSYIMNMRLVNYNIDINGYYHNCDDYIISLNKYIKLTNDFNIVEEKLFESNYDGRRYIGIEDIKIINYNNEIRFIGTGMHKNGNIGICHGVYDIKNDELFPLEIKASFSNNICEKNWVYVIVDDELFVVYQWYPLKICKIEERREKEKKSVHTLKLIKNQEMPMIFDKIRGSTCGFNFENEIWFIVHMVSYENPRHYYHLFVIFDEKMKLLRYSAPFKFEGEPIEYCVGLIVEPERVVIPYSVWDRTSRIAVFDKKYIDDKIIYKP